MTTTQDVSGVSNALNTIATSRKAKERRKEQQKKWKSLVNIYGGKGCGKTFAQTDPNGTTRHPVFNAAKNPFNDNTAAGIAWGVSKTGGVIDSGMARTAVQQGFPVSALNTPTRSQINGKEYSTTTTPISSLPPKEYFSPLSGESYYYPQQQPPDPSSSGWIPYGTGSNIPQTFPWTMTSVKPKEHNPEEIKGVFCAYVIAKVGDAQHTGVLFVKKCGFWKILEHNGHKVAGGGAGTFEDMVRSGELKLTVILTIYDADSIEETEETDLEIT